MTLLRQNDPDKLICNQGEPRGAQTADGPLQQSAARQRGAEAQPSLPALCLSLDATTPAVAFLVFTSTATLQRPPPKAATPLHPCQLHSQGLVSSGAAKEAKLSGCAQQLLSGVPALCSSCEGPAHAAHRQNGSALTLLCLSSSSTELSSVGSILFSFPTKSRSTQQLPKAAQDSAPCPVF